jgi:hypothetical protein
MSPLSKRHPNGLVYPSGVEVRFTRSGIATAPKTEKVNMRFPLIFGYGGATRV